MALKAAIFAAKAGQAQVAVELFLGLGDRDRAVRTLEQAGDAEGAARVRSGLTSLGSAAQRQKPARAGGPPPRVSSKAAEKLEASGELAQAMKAYIRESKPAEAARLALQMGRLEDAATLYAEAGIPYRAALCYRRLQKDDLYLAALVRVSHQDEHYRAAALEVVRVASELGVIELEHDQFLADFVESGPRDDEELGTFYQLGKLYLAQNFPENADEVFEKILSRDPDFSDVAALLADLRREGAGDAEEFQKVLEEDVAFWARDVGAEAGPAPGQLPGLPELPPAGSPPGPPQAAAAAPAAGAPAASSPEVGPRGTVALPQGAAGTGFEVGTIVATRYRIEELIGRGGMASVFRALDLELADEVALKVFSQPFTDDEALARFRQELKLSRLLSHPNIVRLYDIGVFQGFRYISMELLIGQGLDAMMEGKALELSTGLAYLLHACMALQAAHDKGIVHRDLKPANMFVIRDDCLKVLDFGIAKHQAAPGLTAVRSLAGTPEYMSPEQISDSSKVTKATDLYALGVIAYEMFTGTRPFQHDDLMPLLNMHLQHAPEPPRRRNAALPESLERVILKLLEKQPEKRFSSCQELGIELSRIRNQEIPVSR